MDLEFLSAHFTGNGEIVGVVVIGEVREVCAALPDVRVVTGCAVGASEEFAVCAFDYGIRTFCTVSSLKTDGEVASVSPALGSDADGESL